MSISQGRWGLLSLTRHFLLIAILRVKAQRSYLSEKVLRYSRCSNISRQLSFRVKLSFTVLYFCTMTEGCENGVSWLSGKSVFS